MKKIIVYTDGGSRGNPGKAAIGVVFCNEKEQIIKNGTIYRTISLEEPYKIQYYEKQKLTKPATVSSLSHTFSKSEIVIDDL